MATFGSENTRNHSLNTARRKIRFLQTQGNRHGSFLPLKLREIAWLDAKGVDQLDFLLFECKSLLKDFDLNDRVLSTSAEIDEPH